MVLQRCCEVFLQTAPEEVKRCCEVTLQAERCWGVTLQAERCWEVTLQTAPEKVEMPLRLYAGGGEQAL